MGKRKGKTGADEPLEAYRRKRSAQSTPEPFGSPSRSGSRLFVVQQHAARRMHYDLRLELGGVLLSWAVPKGPSFDPQVKRLAVEVEQHPVDYGDFEGIIPEGNYGAGAVIVWDRGRWVSIGDPAEGLKKGKLLFDLHGYKLGGRWTLFRTKGEPNSWLLVKKPDAYAEADKQPPAESILSGLTVEQLRDGHDASAVVRRALAQAGAPEGGIRGERVPLMLARVAQRPFSRKDWLFELKYDGFRMIARRDEGAGRLQFRGGGDADAAFPELVAALRGLPHASLVLDGEVVVLDAEGRPSFRLLQQRVHLKRAGDVSLAAIRTPATLFVFDLLACDGYDARPLPLKTRKQILRGILPPAGALRYAEHIDERGEAMFEQVREMGLEGVVAKDATAPYRAGRSPAWLKVRADRVGRFAVVGFTEPQGSRAGFGALHLALYEAGKPVYAGRVGSGFADRDLQVLRDRLEPLRRETCPCEGPVPEGDEHVWVAPGLVATVRYKERTADGALRQPVFLALDEDQPVETCVRDEPRRETPGAGPAVATPRRVLSLTNLDKIFWPEDGHSKGDLIEYYRRVSSRLLPYLRDRPIVLTRYPDGIHGKSFFQKDAPGYVPDWLRTEVLWSEHAKREIHYFVCEDEESLLYVINLGTIPLHLWSSRIDDLQHPDWCILDLDPKEAPFADVVRVARAIHKLCDEIGLECFAKTSGSTGLHVLLPLGRQFTYEQSRWLAELLGRVVAVELPEIATLTRSVGKREGRVYIDFLQNGHGRLLVAPFSVRPIEGAPVSTPLRWSEVRRGLDPRRFNLRTVPGRLARQKTEPMRPLLEGRPDLERALARLERRLP